MAHDLENNPHEINTIKSTSEKIPSPIAARETWWRRLANIFWGYDFFVSYNWSSGGQYAVSLAERLRERGYDCFLDQSEFAAGDDWKREAQKALRNTRRLVIVATREAIVKSEAVRHEIEVFTRRSKRVIPIVFGSRFSEDEQRRFPTLKQIPDSTIDMVEDVCQLEKGPSEKILMQLIQTHRLLRRRSVRALVVAAALTILATASVVASIFWVRAEVARAEEVRQKHLARSAELVNKADLLRETMGPKLDESLQLALEAYENSQMAGESPDHALRAIRQAVELMPETMGEPWLPFGKSVPVRLSAIDHRIVFLREDSHPDGEPFALVVELEVDTEQWRVVRKFTKDNHGELLLDPYGRQIRAPDNLRWLLTQKGGQVTIWDVVKGAPFAQLPFEHKPGEHDGYEVLAINTGAEHVVVRRGRELTIWSLAGSSPRSAALPMEYRPALYAISTSGERLAWAHHNEFVVITTKDGKKVLHYRITGGGHYKSLRFVESPRNGRDMAVFASWSANQVMSMAPMARRNAPSYQAGIWYLDPDALNTESGEDKDTPPNITQVRANPFDIVFSATTAEPSLAILDPQNAVQWLDLESQISFTLGGAAGPGTKARFSGNEILIVHTDGTARLWDLNNRRESLRFTVKDAAVVDTAFLKVRYMNKPQAHAIVTLNTMGYVQGWTSKRNPDRMETLIKGFLSTPGSESNAPGDR